MDIGIVSALLKTLQLSRVVEGVGILLKIDPWDTSDVRNAQADVVQ